MEIKDITLKELIIRTIDRMNENEKGFVSAKRETDVCEDELMANLEQYQVSLFLHYEMARERLEKERVKALLKLIDLYYGDLGGDCEDDNRLDC